MNVKKVVPGSMAETADIVTLMAARKAVLEERVETDVMLDEDATDALIEEIERINAFILDETDDYYGYYVHGVPVSTTADLVRQMGFSVNE